MPIRAAHPSDVAAIGHIVESTELLPASRVEGLLAPYFEAPSGPERWLVQVEGREVCGVAHFARERLTVGTWSLPCIAVRPERQSRGYGRALNQAVEVSVRDLGARLLLAETGAAREFAGARAFYRRLGYREEARVRDFYEPGDDKVVFRKALLFRRSRHDELADHAIRDATAADLPAIVALAIAHGRLRARSDPAGFEAYTHGGRLALEERYLRLFEEAHAYERAVLKVGECAGRVVGYALARREPESFLPLAVVSGWLQEVYVAEEARGRGLGVALVTAACAALSARGAKRVRLAVAPQDTPALALFDALGFRSTSIELQRDEPGRAGEGG